MDDLTKIQIIPITIQDDIIYGDDITNIIINSLKEKNESLKRMM